VYGKIGAAEIEMSFGHMGVKPDGRLINLYGFDILAASGIGKTEIIMGLSKIRVKPDGQFVGFHGIRRLAQVTIDIPKIIIGFGKIRIQLNGRLKSLKSGFGLPQNSFIHDPKIVQNTRGDQRPFRGLRH